MCLSEAERSDAMAKEKKSIGVKNKELGRRGEAAAARYLEHLGYEVLDMNWQCPAGEADIVARDADSIVFCEVKTRSSIEKGFPSEAVNEEKRARYEKIALWYLRDCSLTDMRVRFDVIALVAVADDRALIKHYVNAFSEGCC